MKRKPVKRKEKKRNRYLYHGSSNKDLTVLEPMRKSWRDEKEGPRVFATQHKGLATTFIPGKANKISVVDKQPFILIRNKKSFLKKDKGGAVYKVKDDSFKNTKSGNKYRDDFPNKNTFLEYEWASRKKVKPVKKEVYDSSLDAMIDNKVIVYFIDKKQERQWNRIFEKLGKEGLYGTPYERKAITEFLDKLKSENEKRGMKKRWWKK